MGFWSDLFGGSSDDDSKWDGPEIDGAAARPDGHTTVYGGGQHTVGIPTSLASPNVHTTDHETREITDVRPAVVDKAGW